jgi:hypothetical protein
MTEDLITSEPQGVISQNTAFFIAAAEKTSNLIYGVGSSLSMHQDRQPSIAAFLVFNL